MGNAELVQKIANGDTVKKIAKDSGISEYLLHKKIYTLRDMVDAKTAAELVAMFFRKGLIN